MANVSVAVVFFAWVVSVSASGSSAVWLGNQGLEVEGFAAVLGLGVGVSVCWGVVGV